MEITTDLVLGHYRDEMINRVKVARVNNMKRIQVEKLMRIILPSHLEEG